MWSISLPMSNCSPSKRDQGHVTHFYILDLENFAIPSRYYALVDCNPLIPLLRSVLDLSYKLFLYTVMQQLARFRLTHRVTRYVYGSRSSCLKLLHTFLGATVSWPRAGHYTATTRCSQHCLFSRPIICTGVRHLWQRNYDELWR